MSADDQMPDRLGPYRLLDRIGEGGMGVVYLARDGGHRTVAVKVLRPGVAGEPNALRRLAREVETMRRVRSPFVAEVIGADLAGDTPYIVTRYVPGRTLDQVIAEQGPVRGAALAGLAQGLADALAAVHAAGVVHRDLKPSNVMLLGGAPVVIDFGIAQGPDATRLTMTGMFMGTPGYLSPEVIEGQPSSEASDVHAWGATVAFAATGRPPFGTGSYETIFYKIVNGQADLDGAPATLLPLLAAALARDPAHRPPAVQLSALAGVLDPSCLVPGPGAGAGQRLADQAAAAQATRTDAGNGQQLPVAGAAGGLAGAAGLGGLAAAGAPANGAWPGGAGLDGAALNGGLLNGSPVNGGPVNGASPNGGQPNGAQPNGAHPYGAPANGAQAYGMPGGALPPGVLPPGALPPGALPDAAGSAVAGGAAAARLAAEAQAAGALAGAGAVPGVPGYGRPGTRPLRAGDFADVLPPVNYRNPGGRGPGGGAAPAAPAGLRPGPAAGSRPAASAPPRGHALLAIASMVVLAGVSVVLPVAGTVAALGLIAMLRAGDAARRGTALRRSSRGARPSDTLVAAVAFPWFLVRSVLGMLVLLVPAAAIAALVAGITMIVVPVDRLPHAVAFAAGTLVVFYGLGPGSGRARHQLSHLYAVATRTRIAQAAALIAVVALAVGAATAAVSWPSLYWPVHPPASFAHLGAGFLGPFRLVHGSGRTLLSHLRGR